MREQGQIRGPAQIPWILSARDRETPIMKVTRGLDEELIERDLAIGAVSSQIPEVPFERNAGRRMLIHVRRTVQGACARTAVLLLEELQHGTAGEREKEIETRNQVGGQIVRSASLQICEGHGR